MKVKQCDKEAGRLLLREIASIISSAGPGRIAERKGAEAVDKAFAKHRADALEEAAKVAERWIEPIMATPHENSTYASIASAIRALIGDDDEK